MKLLVKLLTLALLVGCAPLAVAQTISIAPEYEQTIITPDSTSIHIVIRFKARPVAENTARAPMSLALVIDRSGSMSEAGKLSYAKMAARDLIKRLTDKDYLSLVAYDTDVEVLQPAVKMTRANQEKVLRMVDNLYPSSATNLYGGMEAGFNQLLKADTAGLKRVILLSDGLANVGTTQASQIAARASSAKQKGVTLTAMGLGEDYDEDLMQLIAQRGGGNYYYIRNPEDSSRFFASELKGVFAGVSKNINLQLILGPQVEDVKVYGYTVSGEGKERQIDLSDFYGDEERMMILEFKLKSPRTGTLGLAGLRLEYNSLLENKMDTQIVPLAVEVSRNASQAKASANKDVQVEVLALQADEKYAQALSAASEGRFAEAEQIVADTRAQLSSNPLTSQSELLSSRQEAMTLEEERISAVAAAPVAQQQDYIKQGRNRIYNASMGKINMQQMSNGSSGLEVELLQNALSKLGFYSGPINGIYSDDVEEAVKSYQQSQGLKADGIAGPATQNALGLY